MCPTIRTLDPDKPDVVYVSIELSRAAHELDSIQAALPELRRELSKSWPIQDVTLLLRNPAHLTQWEISIAIALATPILKPLGEKLRDEAFRWLRRRFKSAKKKRKRTRR